eukprot:gnl/TRDRNA2_/TRDRNA2_174230_c4_seq60.p1 gnl/TRDRNA2_/TRDRNA2_174230_c4~~gnl/TRDRNA2_/TRDRNA2_174230_c4_seq60.p1  ORF type:complete len:463 (-),score=113.07 gnl/TRDRNA2_/TRDRNA2_174230_c4_seq60:68-1456(-)
MGETPGAKYVAEFVGTFLLVFTIGCNVITGSATWAATSIAAVLMVSIYALAGVSGANFNPAVSVALGISNKLDWKEVGIYSIVQIIGGIIGGTAAGVLMWDVVHLAPGKGFQWWQASAVEFLYTFMLCFVVLNVACTKKHRHNQFYGLAIGFVIVAGGYGGGHISMGCFNPAVAFGIDVPSASRGFGYCLVYTCFELAGAAAAAFLFMVIRPEDCKKKEDEEDEEDEEADVAYPLHVRSLSEFLGTYFLVLTVGLNVLGGSPAAVWSIAAALMCMIFALGSRSGAHFNPAVTVAILSSGRGKISPADAVKYIVVQIFGGICAAFSYAAMENFKTFPLQPGAKYGWGAALGAEVVFTFVLCLVVLCVATTKAGLSQWFGLAIGSCVTAGGYAIGAVSGGSLNPAVSVGISTADLHLNPLYHGTWMNCIGYSLAEFAGAILAAVVFRVTHTAEYPEELEKKASA